MQKLKKKVCQEIMNKCQKSQQDTAGVIQNVNNAILNERLRGHEYLQNVEIIQDLDSNKP